MQIHVQRALAISHMCYKWVDDSSFLRYLMALHSEATPVFEAQRLQADLQRAGITNKWWVINSSMLLTNTQNAFLKAKAQSEIQWIEKVKELSNGNFAVIPWREIVE